MSKVKSNLKTISIITFLLVYAVIFYTFTPIIGIKYESSIVFIIIPCIFLSLLLMPSKGRKSLYGIVGFIVVVFFIMLILTAPIFRAKAYKSILPTPKYKEFSREISYIDEKNIPTVNSTYANLLADKKLGEEPSLGSRVTIGELTLQNVKGKLYYVAPLNHSSFLKWLFNKSTPGYIMVSATNDHDVKLVKEMDNTTLAIKYSPSAYFNNDLKRHIYLSGIVNKGITDFTFELDDEGKPYWTATLYKNSVGFSGRVVTGTAIVDAQTGDVKSYSIENTPAWVDRIQPLDFIDDNLNDWGKYIHGFFNFSGKDKLKTTEGYGIIYDNNKCYYYTGLTSIGKDESTVGFALVDTRTKETTIFKVSGATETAGIKSSEGKVQNLGYTGTFPILINVENIPTYFITLNDKNGLTKLFAMVSVSDYNIVGTGENVTECKSSYIRSLQSKGNNLSISSTGQNEKLEGTILRINSYTINGSTYYNFILKEYPNKLFSCAVSLSNELPITQVNDKISIEYNETKENLITGLSFDNLSFQQ